MPALVPFLVALVIAGNLGATRNVSNEELLHEKQGRIIDASTGAGIGGARVIAVWYQVGYGWTGDRGGCDLQKFATTDVHGRYMIPDVSKELDLSGRRPASQTSPFTLDNSWLDYLWGIIVYLPGYIREGDAEAFQRLPLSTKAAPIPGTNYLRQPGPTVYFNWLTPQIQAKIVASTVGVEPIRMVKTQLDPQQRIVYDFWITRAINNCYKANSLKPTGLRNIENDMRRRISDLPCTLPSSTIVGGNVVDDYTFLLADDALDRRLIDGGFANSGCFPCHKDIEAGTLCRAQTGNGQENEKP